MGEERGVGAAGDGRWSVVRGYEERECEASNKDLNKDPSKDPRTDPNKDPNKDPSRRSTVSRTRGTV